MKRRYNHTRECSLQVVSMMLLDKIRFEEEACVTAVLQQRRGVQEGAAAGVDLSGCEEQSEQSLVLGEEERMEWI
jgi:hypothetical protein